MVFRLIFFLFLTVLGRIALAQQVEEAAQPAPIGGELSEHLRLHDTPQGEDLQTAITTLQRGECRVDLIGAIHLAEPSYYEQLNKRFQSYSLVLFEMIGGENLGEALHRDKAQGRKGKAAPEKPKDPKNHQKPGAQAASPQASLRLLHTFYELASEAMALTSQVDGIDYTVRNFRHADLTLREFHRLQLQKNEKLGHILLKSSLRPAPARVPDPRLSRVLWGVLSDQPHVLRQEFAPTLLASMDHAKDILGSSIIFEDRNVKCLQVLDEVLSRPNPPKQMAIFYGAAHLEDLEARLHRRGFETKGQHWITAWRLHP